jgi:hypothetical protein
MRIDPRRCLRRFSPKNSFLWGTIHSSNCPGGIFVIIGKVELLLKRETDENFKQPTYTKSGVKESNGNVTSI